MGASGALIMALARKRRLALLRQADGPTAKRSWRAVILLGSRHILSFN